MPRDWKADLVDLRDRLETTKEQNVQRDHYYHGVIFLDATPSEELERVIPGIYASGWRVAERYLVRLPQGGHHLHFICDDNPVESDHSLLDLFRREISRVQTILKSIPKSVVPQITMPPIENGSVENMLHWLYLLHWLGTQRNGIFTTQIEFLPTIADYQGNYTFREWAECSTVPDFEPAGVTSLTLKEGEGVEHWKAKHEAAGKRMPEVIASSLSKPLLYASFHAANIILERAEARKQHRNRTPTEPEEGALSDDGAKLLDFLIRHHKCNSQDPCFDPIKNQKAIGDVMNTMAERNGEKPAWNQTRVSRAFKELFANVTRFRHRQPGTRYRKLCDNGELCQHLLSLVVHRYERGTRREFGVQNPDDFSEKGY